MILTGSDIRDQIKLGHIEITPFDPNCIGPNSYDVHLSEHLLMCDAAMPDHLDAKKDNADLFKPLTIGPDGLILHPNRLYLGSTIERTKTPIHIPYIEGKSSTGRLGVSVHITAGKGDVGFEGYWTLEITVAVPVKLYAGMPIAQITFFTPKGKLRSYGSRKGSKYANQGPGPQTSKMHLNFSNNE